MPEATEFTFEKAVAVAGFLGETGGDQTVESLGFLEFGRGALQSLLFALPFPCCAAMMPAQLRLSLCLAVCSAECSDGGKAEITPFESRDSSHKADYIQNAAFLLNSRQKTKSLGLYFRIPCTQEIMAS